MEDSESRERKLLEELSAAKGHIVSLEQSVKDADDKISILILAKSSLEEKCDTLEKVSRIEREQQQVSAIVKFTP